MTLVLTSYLLSGFQKLMYASEDPSASAEGMSLHWKTKQRIFLLSNRLGGAFFQVSKPL
jgi:hypothetical protein